MSIIPPAQRWRKSDGSAALESVMVLPVVAVIVAALVAVAGIITDLVILHDGARTGARAAATTTSQRVVVDAVEAALPEFAHVAVNVSPQHRSPGTPVTVEVAATRSLGPVEHTLTARASAITEPVIDSSWTP
ncbi:MAG: hypothetical protein WD576_04200 [Nitriliruptoraceae bacterium]